MLLLPHGGVRENVRSGSYLSDSLAFPRARGSGAVLQRHLPLEVGGCRTARLYWCGSWGT